MKSSAVKRSIVVGGHKTSVSLEEAFWSGMKEISRARGTTLYRLVSEIDANRNQGNLSSAIRQFVLNHFKGLASSGLGLSHDDHATNSRYSASHRALRRATRASISLTARKRLTSSGMVSGSSITMPPHASSYAFGRARGP